MLAEPSVVSQTGEITLEELGEPKNPPVQPVAEPTKPPAESAGASKKPDENRLVFNAAGEGRVPAITAMDFPQLYEELGVEVDNLAQTLRSDQIRRRGRGRSLRC
jgi:hypothetical protein